MLAGRLENSFKSAVYFKVFAGRCWSMLLLVVYLIYAARSSFQS